MSILPQLEPVLGASLALNLAFVNLSAFAYLSRISDSVGNYVNGLDDNVVAAIQDTKWYKRLCHVSDVKIFEDEPFFFKRRLWIPLPFFTSIFYNILFYWRGAKAGCLVGVVFSTFFLVIGTAHNAELWTSTNCWGSDPKRVMFWATISLLWPMICALLGTTVRWRIVGYANEQLGDLRQAKKANAQEKVADAERAIGRLIRELKNGLDE